MASIARSPRPRIGPSGVSAEAIYRPLISLAVDEAAIAGGVAMPRTAKVARPRTSSAFRHSQRPGHLDVLKIVRGTTIGRRERAPRVRRADHQTSHCGP
jgi:hypothetical protein